MQKLLSFLCFIFFCITLAEGFFIWQKKDIFFPGKPKSVPKPLLIYSFENLRKTTFPASPVIFGGKIFQNTTYFSQVFSFQTPIKPNSKQMETVSGLMNAPVKPGIYPVIVMLRGFVPENIYTPGIGTEPVAKMLASNGFITLAPDFLGFGTSSPGAKDSFENRFQTYTTTLSLLSSLPNLNSGLRASYSGSLTADTTKVGIWAHSNGGHIALSTLAISGVNYPTVLWAPVSASFPYSILYYTDEDDDKGKLTRKVLSQFEDVYDTGVFDPSNYYVLIKAPMDIEQGTGDVEVPYWWTDNLVKTLKQNGNDVSENLHLGADHNMLPASTWSDAVTNTLEFYKAKLGK